MYTRTIKFGRESVNISAPFFQCLTNDINRNDENLNQLFHDKPCA